MNFFESIFEDTKGRRAMIVHTKVTNLDLKPKSQFVIK